LRWQLAASQAKVLRSGPRATNSTKTGTVDATLKTSYDGSLIIKNRKVGDYDASAVPIGLVIFFMCNAAMNSF
jgi:hypothetical protein